MAMRTEARLTAHLSGGGDFLCSCLSGNLVDHLRFAELLYSCPLWNCTRHDIRHYVPCEIEAGPFYRNLISHATQDRRMCMLAINQLQRRHLSIWPLNQGFPMNLWLCGAGAEATLLPDMASRSIHVIWAETIALSLE